MVKIVLLSCTKSKLNVKSKAKDLYSASPTFSKTLEYGISLKPNKIYILSAKHHLLDIDTMIEPYDLTLKDMDVDSKKEWGYVVVQQMIKKNIDLDNTLFIFLTGKEYMNPLLDYIPKNNVKNPLLGKRMGERLQWLNKQINKINEFIQKIYENIQRRFKKIN